MEKKDQPEVWQRGPISGVPALLQPVAHALLQSQEDCERIMAGFPPDLLWHKPAGLASAGFHLRHVAGVVDRLFTYARGESLSQAQLAALQAEQAPGTELTAEKLLTTIRQQIKQAIAQLSETDEASLTAARTLGRRKLPTSVIGLLFHAAEHTQRHTGQLLVTARFVRQMNTRDQAGAATEQ